MSEKQIDFVSEYIYRFFLHIADSIEAGKLAEALLPEVVEDVERTADPDKWGSGDIDIALTRVLVKRLAGED